MTLKFLQWNIWYKEDPDKVAKFLAELRPDIMCLQEVQSVRPSPVSSDVGAIIISKLGDSYRGYFARAHEWKDAEGNIERDQGNSIISRFPLANPKRIFTQRGRKGSDDFSAESRIYSQIDLHINDSDLTVATTHCSYTDRFESTAARDKENSKLIGAIGQRNEKYIFAGDLNAAPDSELVQTLAGKTGLISCGPDFSQNSWANKPFSYNGFEEDELNWRLDFVFATPDLKVVKSEILRTELSDHLPVLIEFEI